MLYNESIRKTGDVRPDSKKQQYRGAISTGDPDYGSNRDEMQI